MRIVVINYKFVLDPQVTYTRLSEFESDLSELFKNKGVEVVIGESTNDSSQRYIFLHKAPSPEPPKEPGATPKEQLSKLQKELKKGK